MARSPGNHNINMVGNEGRSHTVFLKSGHKKAEAVILRTTNMFLSSCACSYSNGPSWDESMYP
ncbi:hypothetical protein N7468_006508 [Penicillium chermesinum]|uniref:Uncharacterized protein n=1 Tax=Penicillium chermesinum TaxID=63820 RepID=A0A9W9NST7_9EURO|nr:uncharacterized protein N7468_006508 [Penicillium chermesinum]KAJ5225283.1 hypothetical protein N7468_006508 [Penicillium chermesinum]KAJ6140590.1 hypothetical protein N7470_010386 [Penicillium chermesinum]